VIVFEIIFWSSVILLLHSYLFYPILLEILSPRKKTQNNVFSKNDELPTVSILLAVHNEEKVIEEKIRSTVDTSYPIHKIEWLIGSDQSTDQTENIIHRYSQQMPVIRLLRFEGRTGKVDIINQLAQRANGDILILTDANVFFGKETIYELVKHYKELSVALVAGNILNPSLKADGISKQESAYVFMENRIKYKEGILWGAIMGAFGGCYSLRRNFFKPTPSHFIVDDFFITLSVLEQGGKAICELSATCYEDVSNKMSEEFRRKTRIATGNFQNFRHFLKLLSPRKGGLAFAYWSHKVLRWLGPFFIILAYLSSFILSFSSDFYKVCFWIQTGLFSIPFLDALLQKLKIHFPGLRYISHFYVMNLALLNGFFKFLTGVKNNVWIPTERNQ